MRSAASSARCITAQSQMALASNTAQLYAALVYVTPLAGGYIADRLIGRTATVSIGAIIMVIGTFLLALNSTFLIALALLLAASAASRRTSQARLVRFIVSTIRAARMDSRSTSSAFSSQ